MNQRYGYNDGRQPHGDDPRGGGRGESRFGEGNYEGDWGGQREPFDRGGYGPSAAGGRHPDGPGWGESRGYPDGRHGQADYGPQGPASAYPGPRGPGRGDPGDHYLREWAGQGRGGQSSWGGRDFGAGQDLAGHRAYGSPDYARDPGRGYMGSMTSDSQAYGGAAYARPAQGADPYRQDDMYGAYGGHGLSDRAGQPRFDRGRQGFRGKGPKGYKRSDERLQEDISERLMDDDAIDASDITVQCREGVVTLEGSVSDRWMKHRAEDLVERCHGVGDIENRLTVQRRGMQDERPDADDGDSGSPTRSGGNNPQNPKKKH